MPSYLKTYHTVEIILEAKIQNFAAVFAKCNLCLNAKFDASLEQEIVLKIS